MNRREFLKSLAALGAVFTIPLEALAIVPDTVIDGVWKEAIDDPMTFYVNEWLTLSTDSGPYAPSTRGEMLMIEPINSREELLCLARDEGRVASLIEAGMVDDEEADPKGDWESWLESTDDDTVEYLIEQANSWVTGEPDSGEWERANICGYSNTGGALSFFRHDFEYNEMFDISVIEGDCPGSTYFAAELGMNIDEANALAIEQGIPIRFALMEI